MLDKFPIVVDKFKGVKVSDEDINASDAFYSQYLQDVVGIDEAFEAENIEYLKTGGFKTRNGFQFDTKWEGPTFIGAQREITGFWQIKDLLGVAQSNRFLISTWDGTTGYIYDTGLAHAANPVLTLTGMKYAFVLNAFGKMWLSPWSDWGVPLDYGPSAKHIYLYTGAYNFRGIQGAIPTTDITVADSATAGVVTAGYHYFSVAYETDTGYITFPCNYNPTVFLNAAGSKKIDVTNIPVGPTGTAARLIIMTKVISPYPNPLGVGFAQNEPFFVARIADNTTTTATLNTPDSGLVESAAYLLDRSERVPPVVSMAVYRNRMIYISPKAATYLNGTFTDNAVFISPPNEPEVVNQYNTDGSVLIVGPDYTGRPHCGAELRGTFYIFKKDSTFAIQENLDLDPMEWTVNLIDSGLGAYPTGIANIADNPGNLILDNLLVANDAGLFAFTGSFNPVPISKGIWDNITNTVGNYAQMYIDPVRKLLYLVFGPVLANQLDYIWIGNYYLGYDSESIRWSKLKISPDARWPGFRAFLLQQLPTVAPYPILTSVYKTTRYYQIVTQRPGLSADFTATGAEVPISWLLSTGYTPSEIGDLLTFAFIRVRAMIASGSLSVSTCGLDSNTFTTLVSEAVGNTPAKFFTYPMNMVGEKVRFKLSGVTRVLINKMIIFASEYGKNRAR